jgi:hypothetical protein
MAIPLGESDGWKRRQWNEKHGVNIVLLEPNHRCDIEEWLNLPPNPNQISSDGALRAAVAGEICRDAG